MSKEIFPHLEDRSKLPGAVFASNTKVRLHSPELYEKYRLPNNATGRVVSTFELNLSPDKSILELTKTGKVVRTVWDPYGDTLDVSPNELVVIVPPTKPVLQDFDF